VTYLVSLLVLIGSVWSSQGVEGLLPEEPDFTDVAIDAEGTVTLSSALTERAALDETAVWALAEDGRGRLFAATGNQGRVYALDPGAGPRVIFEEEGEAEILAMVTDASGEVVFGTTPGGTVHRIGPGASVSSIFDTDEGYIFALLDARDGTLYCATGPNGRLFAVPPGGESRLLFTAPQTHLTALAWLVPGRELLVGTSPDGLVYRLILKPGSSPGVSVLYDTPLEEVRALAVSGMLVHVGANPGTDSEDGASSWVGCIDTSGVLRWEWTPPESTVFALLPDERGLLVATGGRGIIYRLDDRGRPVVFQHAEQRNVLALAAGASGIWAGTSEPAAALLIGRDLASSGEIVSPAHDCEGPARFGRIDVRADVPAGSGLVLDTRTGSSATPDSTWNAWQQAGAAVASPVARFIQWRARFSSDFPGRTPALHRVDIYYRIPNRPPAITSLEFAEPEPGAAARGEAKPVRNVTWEASDPDGDSLTYELALRGEGETRWTTAAKDLEAASHELDTRMFPDGWYRVRLLASDRAANAADRALETERSSLPIVIDNTPPVVEHIDVKPDRISFLVRDALSPVAGCRVSVNAAAWVTAEPVDGLFDTPDERFSVPVGLVPGENTVAVWASDGQGNSVAARRLVR